MTDFPSTTTDPQLVAAIGQAAARAKPPKQPTRRQRQAPAARRPRRRPFAKRLMEAVAGLLMMAASLWFLLTVAPALLTGLFTSLADVGEPPAGDTPAATATATAAKPGAKTTAKSPSKGTATPTKATTVKTTPKPKPAPKPVVPALAPTDCARATAAEVGKVLGRSVKPVVSARGCAWGTRLDDPSTVLVSITLSADHDSWDTQLQTSAKQRRVVYGTAYGPGYRPGTALWVATGQPIPTGKGRVKALADTHIVISTTELGLTDDQARRKALAIAAALTN